MLWGRGDSSRLEKHETQTLSDLRRMVETGHIIALTPDQSAAMLRALVWYEMWESTFKLLAGIRNMGVVFGGLLAIWWATGGASSTSS